MLVPCFSGEPVPTLKGPYELFLERKHGEDHQYGKASPAWKVHAPLKLHESTANYPLWTKWEVLGVSRARRYRPRCQHLM
jgi:hypothetical protein